VATVKLSSGQGENRGIVMSPGRFRAENWPFKNVIMFAYDLRSNSQISGCPDWVNSTEYDIDAKTDENTTAALGKLPPDQQTQQVKLMVQALLAERFRLRVSYEAKEIPVYAFVIAKGGPKLKKSTGPLSLASGGTRSGIIESKSCELESINSSLDEFAAAAPDLMPESAIVLWSTRQGSPAITIGRSSGRLRLPRRILAELMAAHLLIRVPKILLRVYSRHSRSSLA